MQSMDGRRPGDEVDFSQMLRVASRREMGYCSTMQLPVELTDAQLESLRDRAKSLGFPVPEGTGKRRSTIVAVLALRLFDDMVVLVDSHSETGRHILTRSQPERPS